MLSAITIGSKELAIIRARSDKTLIHTNQAIASIDRQGHGDQEFPFRTWNICDEMIIYFGRNTNNRITMNPSINIEKITPYITSLDSGTGIGNNSDVRRNIGDIIPLRNIGMFGIFYRGTSDLSDKSTLWHGTEKVKVNTLETTAVSKMLITRIILKLKKLGA